MHIREFDGLRGLMAIWVVLGHWGTSIYITIPYSPSLFNSLAVDVFIILSGFAITRLIDFRNERYAGYIARRALRIFPVYLLYLVISIALTFVYIDVWLNAVGTASQENRLQIALDSITYFWPNFVSHFFALQGLVPSKFVPNGAFAFLGQAWSISLEWQFYLLAPFAVDALKRSFRRNFDRYILVSFLVILFLVSRYMPSGFIGADVEYFLLGMATHFLLRYSPVLERAHVLCVVTLGCVSIYLLQVPGRIPLIIWMSSVASVQLSGLGYKGVLSRFLTHPSVLYFGERSYSIYLSHMVPLTLGMLALRHLGVTNPLPHALALLGITLAGTFLASHTSYRWVERPFQNLGRNIAGKSKKIFAEER